MYTLKVLTPPTEQPVSVADLAAHLRINAQDEETSLALFLASALAQWEFRTGRPVCTTVYRQYVEQIPDCIWLMRGGVTSIEAVSYYDVNGELVEDETYTADTVSTPASVWWNDVAPAVSDLVSPVAFVDFAAGWDVESVPAVVRLSLLLLAGHYYERRESHSTDELKPVPLGFQSVCDMFRTGLSGSWGM